MSKQSQPAGRRHAMPEVQSLRDAVEVMDSLSQEGFAEISSIAKLALSALETPDGYRHMGNIVNAFKAIWGGADDIQNCINAEAEGVGCNYVDEAQGRRWAAERQARKAWGKGESHV